MALKLIVVGNTVTSYLKEGEQEYLKRLKKYTQLQYVELNLPKQSGKWDKQKLKQEEGKIILAKLKPQDYVILLDELGKEFSSKDFARYIEKTTASNQSLVFIIGGAYGFSQEVYDRANSKLALSQMTLSHRMVRMFFLEQLYRAFAILRGDPYHH